MPKILLLGNTGQLGWELDRVLQPAGSVVALDFPEIDLADETGIRRIIRKHRPEIVINATAYTAVDQAESEAGSAHAINGIGPGILAEEALKLKALLVHYSTDYVFDGKKGAPYVETDLPNPLNVYGASKLAGEKAIQAVDGVFLILRTAWVYSLRRNSFVTRVLSWARENEIIRVVQDQVSNPTWAHNLAAITASILDKGIGYLQERKGLYHLAGDGFTSRFEWAKAIIELDPHKSEQRVREILPAMSADFHSPAQRPLFSALDCTRFRETFEMQLPDWESALQMAMAADK